MDETKKEQFLKRNKLAICATLRELHKNNTALMVNHSRGHFISNILDVQPDNNTFIFDLGGTTHGSDVFDAELNFVAEPAGAKVEFKANVVSKIDYQASRLFAPKFRRISTVSSAAATSALTPPRGRRCSAAVICRMTAVSNLRSKIFLSAASVC
ncbi:flagellar regulator YcgR PilZN domain-containing protein [Lonsdalea britannica]|uniref:flagellar regulator YcgR PilZN domain-containing protein n=1 Tax=Lonsdalea britannica TaxID=1082704 RepID=UPI002ADE00C9|nr:flagellar regulator YcgR PilZN domain-containing protein [Lonsdalea britannica]